MFYKWTTTEVAKVLWTLCYASPEEIPELQRPCRATRNRRNLQCGDDSIMRAKATRGRLAWVRCLTAVCPEEKKRGWQQTATGIYSKRYKETAWKTKNESDRHHRTRFEKHRPLYLADMCIPVSAMSGRTHLHSAVHCDLVVTRTRLACYGPRGFAVLGPSTWNSLPPDLRDMSLSAASFFNQLKTELFIRAYYTRS